MRRRLPLGISDFKTVVEENYTYVDKTLLIHEILEENFQVLLIPRPRRFGKTLNLSMLRYFFEKKEEDTSYLFKPFKIWQEEKCRKLQGQFPVIYLSLKDVKQPSWKGTFESLRGLIAEEFKRHRYLFEGDVLTPEEKELYHKILLEESSQTLLERSLRLLTEWLERFHGKRVILLVDEYDTPAHAAYVGGYYETLISFLRSWLSGGLKDNKSLERGVLTGILRVAKESIFSGLNNLGVYSLLEKPFSDKFGLVESELINLLRERDSGHSLENFKEWYNGYRMGEATVYNPWSVLQCLDRENKFLPYWINTSDNELIKQLITQGGEELKSQLEPLLKGDILKKPIREGIVFESLKHDVDTVWSLLLFSGYLTIQNPPLFENGLQCELKIPNKEVKFLFEDIIKSWFTQSINQSNFQLLLRSITEGDVKTFRDIFQDLVRTSMSVYDIPSDEPEKVYHAFVLGLLVSLKDTYEIKSNRESGYGRYDVMLIPKDPEKLGEKLGIVFEFKKARSLPLEETADEALKQIESKSYTDELKIRGIKKVLLLGLAFRGKEVYLKDKRIG